MLSHCVIFVAALRLACQSRHIWCDGTFKSVPRLFFQLYTVHGIVGSHVFPLVFCLCSRKTEETYTIIFNHLKEHARRLGLRFAPDRVSMDFERASMNAVHNVLPEADCSGCLFHWAQNLMKKAGEFGLKAAYENPNHPDHREVKRSINTLLGLPFIPLEDIVEVFVELRNTICPLVIPL